MVYTITLNPALDYILRLKEINNKDINRADSAIMLYGGKGINVSVLLSRLRVDNVSLGFIGGFTGDELQRILKNDNVKTDFVKLSEGVTRINVKIFANEQTDINAKGPAIKQDDIKKLFKKLDSLVDGDVLVLAGSVPSGIKNGIYEDIMKYFEKKKINIVVDTTGQELKNVLKYKPFLIKPNHHELSEIFNTDIKSDDEEKIVKYAKELQKMGARNVLVSRGKNGATLIDENGNINTTGIVEGKVVNNVGCGDSMVAGFIAGYEKSNDYLTALKLGSASGNASAFCEGLATEEEIEKIRIKYFN